MAKKISPAPKKGPLDPDVIGVRDGVDGVSKGMNASEIMAAVTTHGGLSATTLKAYSGWSAELGLGVSDLSREMQYAADEVEKGNLGRVERLMAHQFMTLDAIFNNLAQRSRKQEFIKNMETYLRLALKAQSQARATAETLALMKNPMPYIKQANIAQGHQQVNNGVPAHAGDSSFEQSKLLGEANDKTNQRMDSRAPVEAVPSNSELAAVGKVKRPKVARG